MARAEPMEVAGPRPAAAGLGAGLQVGVADLPGDRQAGGAGLRVTGRRAWRRRWRRRSAAAGSVPCSSSMASMSQTKPMKSLTAVSAERKSASSSSRMACSSAANASSAASVVSEEVTASASASGFRSSEIGLGGCCRADQDDPALGLLACAAGAAHRVDEPGAAQPGVLGLPLVGLVVDDDGPDGEVHPVGEGGGAGQVGQGVVADGLLEGFQDLDGQAGVVEADAAGQDRDERVVVAELEPDEVDQGRQGRLLAEVVGQSLRELLGLIAGAGDDQD